ncbi:MAG: RdgB/HAM1 family non-canonical purine NTP pyrophosphatase [Bacteroidia bacterium]|nr:RdgB/HAM1 family non-canonical purine NTP pyrophosphatase [Bacteroidia bacterium]MDW8302713.1 RdgB/HAM1 family non-canonical purine NTP pyrophosphatase [Bacteroidia bacterium]
MRKIVLATRNTHKIEEIKQLLPQIELLTLHDVGLSNVEIPETSETFVQNALLKAKTIFNLCCLPCLADDSGLEVFVLNNRPGIHSAYYSGTRDSQKNVQKLLEEMKYQTNRRARFRTVIAYYDENSFRYFEGIVYGTITDTPKGTQGFGYDPIFIPDGHQKTYAEMSLEEKNAVSHRAKAIQKLADFFTQILNIPTK